MTLATSEVWAPSGQKTAPYGVETGLHGGPWLEINFEMTMKVIVTVRLLYKKSVRTYPIITVSFGEHTPPGKIEDCSIDSCLYPIFLVTDFFVTNKIFQCNF